MDFNISAQHTELTPSLEQAVKDKFNRFQEHADKPLQAHIVLRVDSGKHIVDAKVTGLGKTLVAKSESKDMYTAINEASRLLDRQWRKNKTAKLSSRRKGSLKDVTIAANATPVARDPSEDNVNYEAWASDVVLPSAPKP